MMNRPLRPANTSSLSGKSIHYKASFPCKTNQILGQVQKLV